MSTISKEDYVKVIYELKHRNNNVRSSDIAEALTVSKPATTDMMKKLIRDDYVSKGKSNEIILTDKGNKTALKLLRKHRLWEIFLHQVLKLNWEEIHEEAERLEHSTSDYLTEKIDEYLGFPEFDPHGSPIPDKDGNIKYLSDLDNLSNKSSGKFIVKNIYDKDRGFIEALNNLGVKLNCEIEVIKTFEFDLSLQVKVNSSEHVITKKFAENIHVVPF